MLRHFCLGTCAYQKYRRFRFLDYLGFMDPLRLTRFTTR